MKERPIIFSGEMVRAILEGRKTQTRRVMKPQPYPITDRPEKGKVYTSGWFENEPPPKYIFDLCPYGLVGDRLWVRETWAPGVWLNQYDDLDPGYRASWAQMARNTNFMEPRWRPSIHMPRWASRITLEIVGVRVERVQEISREDAIAEGMRPEDEVPWHDVISEYACLWNSINAKCGYGWDSNPWVWVVEFRRV